MLCLVPRTLRVLGLQSVAWSRAVDYFPQSGRRLGDESSAASLPGQTPARESCLQLDWLYQTSASWYRTCTRRGARASTNRRSLWAQPSRSTGCEPSALRALMQVRAGRLARGAPCWLLSLLAGYSRRLADTLPRVGVGGVPPKEIRKSGTKSRTVIHRSLCLSAPARSVGAPSPARAIPSGLHSASGPAQQVPRTS